jgi:hypothetical protein
MHSHGMKSVNIEMQEDVYILWLYRASGTRRAKLKAACKVIRRLSAHPHLMKKDNSRILELNLKHYKYL